MEGKAQFAELPQYLNTLHYKESGIFTLDSGRTFNCSQEYLYQYSEGQISVLFLKNQKPNGLFHVLEFTELLSSSAALKASGRHYCLHDTYEVLYDFGKSNRFNIIYKVHGPSKNYTSNTFFVK
jgi:hypothetical protein